MTRGASEKQIEQYRRNRANGMSQERAAGMVGLSAAWGYLLERKDRDAVKKREATEGGMPKNWLELDGGVKDCLKDFNLFAETFLARRPVPWRLDAANRVVEWLTDKSEDTYAVLNMPPRAGKTTLFTLDIPLWLICGGGVCDPEVGRAIRILLGHRIEKESKKYVTLIRNILEFTRPFYCAEQKREAELVLAQAFGRFRPQKTLGEFDLWRDNEFVVAQIGSRSIYQKDRTVCAASREGGFLGTRVDLSVWDDLVTTDTCRNVESAEAINEWWENEAEERIEPGGANLLVGQRLSSLDLYRFRLDKSLQDDRGEESKLYHHIIYPAHNEATCPNGDITLECAQWDGHEEGCLLDAKRLPPKKLWQARTKEKFRTVFQQEDANPEDSLVQDAWIYGGTDQDGYPSEGCLDNHRAFYEWPENKMLIDYVCVDPSAANYWAFEWWAVDPEPPYPSYLIWGQRKRMLAGTDSGFLDYNPKTQQHVGAMEDIQQLSGDLGHPIRVWIVEANAAHRYLFGTHAYRTWRRRWPLVEVLQQQTQSNKSHKELGIQALLPYRYKVGLKRLPYKRGTDQLNYVRTKIAELTKYPHYQTDDTVMADWFGEYKREDILFRAKALKRKDYGMNNTDPHQPDYMRGRSLASV